MVHRYQLGGLNIVLDICSGSVHVVDEIAYDMIGRYEDTDRETLLRDMYATYGHREDVTAEELAECYAILSTRLKSTSSSNSIKPKYSFSSESFISFKM